MSIKLMSLIWANHSDLFSPNEKSVLIRMADFAKADDGTSIYPGITRLSKDTAISRRSVIRCIDSLVKKGVLILVKKGSSAFHLANLYRINVDLLEEMSVDKSPKKRLYKKEASVTVTPGASATVTLGASVTVAPHLPLRSVIKIHKHNDHSANDLIVDNFKEFWDLYPKNRRIAKKEALKYYQHIIKTLDPAVLIEGLKAQLIERKQKALEGLFVPDWPHPSKWLKNERWNDEVMTGEEIKSQTSQKAPNKAATLRNASSYSLVPSVEETRRILQGNWAGKTHGPINVKELLGKCLPKYSTY